MIAVASLLFFLLDINAISADISACYDACKKMSLSKETMHTASQIMSLSGKSVEVKVSDLDNTVTALKEHKLKGMRYELMPMAAALGLIEETPEEKATAIKENFDYPYCSKSVSEFWRRWHMSLGLWFKNYVFYPVQRTKICMSIRKKMKQKKNLRI